MDLPSSNKRETSVSLLFVFEQKYICYFSIM